MNILILKLYFWQETNPNYRTMKIDSDDEFMRKLRKGVKKLNLKGGNGV